MIRITHFLLLLFFLTPLPASAQIGDVLQDTITWTANQSTNLSKDTTIVHATSFTCYGKSTIVMANASSSKTFTITSTEGFWPDLSFNGEILYHILFNNKAGTVRIAKTDAGTLLVLDMSNSFPDGIKNKYRIDHYSNN